VTTTIEGTLSAAGLRFAIVASRFNSLIVEPLVGGAVDAIVRSGGSDNAITIVRCPGAWELPQVVRRVIERGGIDAVIALGAVIRGATPHFDYVAGEASRGLSDASAAFETPIGFGVLTCDDMAQAEARAGGEHGNKGWDAALAALEMADLFDRLDATDES
jgi:6,7-dimethyl-8-ribityllumazine synthase